MPSVLERLSDKFTVGDGCWEWTASKDRHGYGWFGIGKRNYRAHRVLYELMVGPIPDGLILDHICFNKSCVRPSHLEPVTQKENIHRFLYKEYLEYMDEH